MDDKQGNEFRKMAKKIERLVAGLDNELLRYAMDIIAREMDRRQAKLTEMARKKRFWY